MIGVTHHHESPQAINGLLTHGYKSLGDFQTMATQSQQNTHTTTILFLANLLGTHMQEGEKEIKK